MLSPRLGGDTLTVVGEDDDEPSTPKSCKNNPPVLAGGFMRGCKWDDMVTVEEDFPFGVQGKRVL
jgi:hypothetical protein